jgi:hypothetical protein
MEKAFMFGSMGARNGVTAALLATGSPALAKTIGIVRVFLHAVTLGYDLGMRAAAPALGANAVAAARPRPPEITPRRVRRAWIGLDNSRWRGIFIDTRLRKVSRYDRRAMRGIEWLPLDDKATSRLAPQRNDGGFDFHVAVNGQRPFEADHVKQVVVRLVADAMPGVVCEARTPAVTSTEIPGIVVPITPIANASERIGLERRRDESCLPGRIRSRLQPFAHALSTSAAPNGAAAWPLAARAQQGNRVRRIGYLTSADENDPVAKTWVSAFTSACGLGLDRWPQRADGPSVGASWRATVVAIVAVTMASRDTR